MTQPDNLLTVKIVKCRICYDYGVVIDRFDQAKRIPCHCPAGGRDETQEKEPPDYKAAPFRPVGHYLKQSPWPIFSLIPFCLKAEAIRDSVA